MTEKAELTKEIKTRTINLRFPMRTNGEELAAGTYNLPVEAADELERRQEEYQRYLDSLRESDEVNAALSRVQ